MPLARPVPPVQPDLEDCCRSGCTPCVFDLYEEALERYERELAAWEAAHPPMPPPPHCAVLQGTLESGSLPF